MGPTEYKFSMMYVRNIETTLVAMWVWYSCNSIMLLRYHNKEKNQIPLITAYCWIIILVISYY